MNLRPNNRGKRRVRSVATSVLYRLKLGRSRRLMDQSSSWNQWLFAPAVAGLFFPQRKALGLDARESTPGFKRQLVILNAEVRSLKRVRIVVDRILGQKVSTNTVERICLDVAEDLATAERRAWDGVIDGEVPVPSLAIVEFEADKRGQVSFFGRPLGRVVVSRPRRTALLLVH